MVIPNEQAVYHVMSRTALDGFPIGSVEKDFLLKLIKRFSKLYLAEILGFCLMGNHSHLLVKMVPDSDFSDDDIAKRVKRYYGPDYKLPAGPLGTLPIQALTPSHRPVKIFGIRDPELFLRRQFKRHCTYPLSRCDNIFFDEGMMAVRFYDKLVFTRRQSKNDKKSIMVKIFTLNVITA